MSGTATPTRAVGFSPTPRLTVTVEAGAQGHEVHLHAGGQGVWEARMLVQMGIDTTLHAPLGGEVGAVLRALLTGGGVHLATTAADSGTNGAYVHDRRSGERHQVAEMAATPLTRHDIDDLYGSLVIDAREADVAVIGGPDEPGVVSVELYERLAEDLVTGGTPVVADLSEPELGAVVRAGPALVKVSDDELVNDGRAASNSARDVAAAMEDLATEGAHVVAVTRAERPTLALVDGQLWSMSAPSFVPVETAGGGDSFTAGCAAALAAGDAPLTALRLGSAAGALNVTRRGLGSGRADTIRQAAGHVRVHPVDDIDAVDEVEPDDPDHPDDLDERLG